MNTCFRLPLLVLIGALAGASAGAQEPIAGAVFQVNTHTTGYESQPAAAHFPDGGFVVVWRSERSNNSDIVARLFSSGGGAQTGELGVNTYTTGRQSWPSVCTSGTGGFVVTWQSYDQVPPGAGADIFGQRFDSLGLAQGSEFLVNTYTTFNQRRPEMACGPDGGFVVVWEHRYSDGVFGQRFDSLGLALGSEQFQVNTSTSGFVGSPAVASDAQGNFVVAFSGSDEVGEGVFHRRYSSGGAALDALQVVSAREVSSYTVRATRHEAGDFVIVWNEGGFDPNGPDQSAFVRRYASSGQEQAAFDFPVAEFSGESAVSAAFVDPTGRFVVTWVDAQKGPIPIHGQVYEPPAAALGGPFTVQGEQRRPRGRGQTVSSARDGSFVVVWDGTDTSGARGTTNQMHAQIYSLPTATPTVTPTPTATATATPMILRASGGSAIPTALVLAGALLVLALGLRLRCGSAAPR
jgi:hypothetical protein